MTTTPSPSETKGGPAGPPFSSSFWSSPYFDIFRGLERCLDGGLPAFAKVAVGMVVAWWLYVPMHELLHALGCVATGGTVTRLEIAPMYGGQLFAAIFPFVHPASEYAGRLSGFSTGGSDFVYLATDLAPFLLTLFPGFWWLRRAGRRGDAFRYGASLPVALAPLTSVTGDAYEIGSILATRLPPFVASAGLLRGDDLVKKLEELRTAAASATEWGGLALGVVLALGWVVGMLGLSGWLAGRVGERPLPPQPRLNLPG